MTGKKYSPIAFKIESSPGTLVDLSGLWKSQTVYDAEGNPMDIQYSDEYLKELDEKYGAIVEKIIAGRNR